MADESKARRLIQAQRSLVIFRKDMKLLPLITDLLGQNDTARAKAARRIDLLPASLRRRYNYLIKHHSTPESANEGLRQLQAVMSKKERIARQLGTLRPAQRKDVRHMVAEIQKKARLSRKAGQARRRAR